MLKKSLLKAAILLTFLVLVIYLAKCTSSFEFKNSLNNFFADSSQKLKWCPDHTVDFVWIEPTQKLSNWSQAKPKIIQETFCEIPVDSFIDNQPNFKFKLLLKARTAEGRSAELEWDSAAQKFKVQEIIFTSSDLVKKLK